MKRPQYKVVNRTQARLEIPELRRVLDGGAWTVVSDPLPESVRRMMGGSPGRKIDVEEHAGATAPQAPAPEKKPAAAGRSRPQDS